MPDFGADVMVEALAMAKPIYKIPIIPLPNSSQYRHQDHVELKDYRAKVRVYSILLLFNLGENGYCSVCKVKCIDFFFILIP